MYSAVAEAESLGSIPSSCDQSPSSASESLSVSRDSSSSSVIDEWGAWWSIVIVVLLSL